jgi:hypothetical protein
VEKVGMSRSASMVTVISIHSTGFAIPWASRSLFSRCRCCWPRYGSMGSGRLRSAYSSLDGVFSSWDTPLKGSLPSSSTTGAFSS